MKKLNKEQKGITLVALVITVIILLILAGVTITQLSGSGLFTKTNNAATATKKAQYMEELKMEMAFAQTEIAGGSQRGLTEILVERIEQKSWINNIEVLDDDGNIYTNPADYNKGTKLLIVTEDKRLMMIDIDNQKEITNIKEEFFPKIEEATVTVSFDGNGSSVTGIMNDENVINGFNMVLPENNYVNKYFVFTGWSRYPSGKNENNELDIYSAGSKIQITGDTTLYAQWEDNYEIEVDSNIRKATISLDGIYTYVTVEYVDKDSTDKTYYRVGTDGVWEEYNDIIKLDMSCIQNADNLNGNTGTSTIYLKKVDQNAQELISNKQVNIYSTAFDVFNSLKVSGISDNTSNYFTSNLPSNQYSMAVPNCLSYGHWQNWGSYSGYYDLQFNTLNIDKVGQIFADFGNVADGNSSCNTAMTIYYTDGTNSGEQLSNKTSETDVSHFETNFNSTIYNLTCDVDQNKTIDFIRFRIYGYDADYYHFQGFVRNIIFKDATKKNT